MARGHGLAIVVIYNNEMNAAGWFQVVVALRDDQRAVLHQPETTRYARARIKLAYLLANASPLGIRAGEGGRDSAIELHRGFAGLQVPRRRRRPRPLYGLRRGAP